MSDFVPDHQQLRSIRDSADAAAHSSGDTDMPIVPYNSAAAAAMGKRKATGPPKKQRKTVDSVPDATVAALGQLVAHDMEELERRRSSDSALQQQTATLQQAIDAMNALRGTVQQLTAQVAELSGKVGHLQEEVAALKSELQSAKTQHRTELQALTEQHAKALDHARQGAQAAEDIALAPQLQPIERNIVLAPKYPPNTHDPKPLQLTLGKLTLAHAASFLGIPEQDIRSFTKIPPRREQGPSGAWKAGEACSHIIVELRSRTTKLDIIKGANRKELEKHPCAALSSKDPQGHITSPYYLSVREHLLGVELAHKRELQASAMDLLQKDQQDLPQRDRVAYSWRRAKITWRVTVDNQGCWALLSHLDVPPGSTLEEVKAAVRRAEARATLELARRGPQPPRQPAPAGTSASA